MALSKKQIIALGIGASALGIGTAVAVRSIAKRRKKNSKRKQSNRSKNTKRRNSYKKGRRTPHTAGKRKDTSRRRIRYTKNGQPYVIQYRNINGKRRKMARFISKKSAKSSHKRSGGRY